MKKTSSSTAFSGMELVFDGELRFVSEHGFFHFVADKQANTAVLNVSSLKALAMFIKNGALGLGIKQNQRDYLKGIAQPIQVFRDSKYVFTLKSGEVRKVKSVRAAKLLVEYFKTKYFT